MIIKLCWRIKALFSSSSYYRKEKKLKKRRLNVVKEVMNASKQAPMAWCWNCLQFALQNMGDWIPPLVCILRTKFWIQISSITDTRFYQSFICKFYSLFLWHYLHMQLTYLFFYPGGLSPAWSVHTPVVSIFQDELSYTPQPDNPKVSLINNLH
jgi:hypothetical protein